MLKRMTVSAHRVLVWRGRNAPSSWTRRRIFQKCRKISLLFVVHLNDTDRHACLCYVLTCSLDYCPCSMSCIRNVVQGGCRCAEAHARCGFPRGHARGGECAGTILNTLGSSCFFFSFHFLILSYFPFFSPVLWPSIFRFTVLSRYHLTAGAFCLTANASANGDSHFSA